jgi:hypothetical protein
VMVGLVLAVFVIADPQPMGSTVFIVGFLVFMVALVIWPIGAIVLGKAWLVGRSRR